MIKPKQQNWFYIASLIFAIVLPFSLALISVSIGLLFLAALIHANFKNIADNLKDRWILLFITGIFFVYVIWLYFTTNWEWALYDLRKNSSYLFVPLAFFLAPKLSKRQTNNILYVFSFSVVVSALITFIEFYFKSDQSVLSAQKYGFLHHIRFSLEIVLAIFILISELSKNGKELNIYIKSGITIALIILGTFLIWHQSLTGIFAFIGTAFIAIIIWTKRLQKKSLKIAAVFALIFITFFPAFYLSYAINRFYTVDKIEPAELEKVTSQGNPYFHDVNNKSIENGHYVWLYVCEKELEQEWNKRSNLKYNELDQFGYPVKSTLIRYLTSKDLRKDAVGVKALTAEDIRNIENGISNYIFANRKLSIYPRIYVSIWELDTYFKTGNANNRSLAQRIEYTKAAFYIIKNNFWLGVGTGNWKDAYKEAYIHNKSQMAPERFGNVHNQYLNYMVKFGMIGFMLIMLAIIYPVIKIKAYKIPLFLLFLIMMFIANFGDANLETHTGANFFIFFYCLFLVSKLG